MNGVHDLGGMHGFGAIAREADESSFDADSAVRIRLLMSLAIERGLFNIDAFRYGIERMPPADYLRASYFARWLTSVTANLIEAGVVTAEEVDARTDLLRRLPDGARPAPRPREDSRPPATHRARIPAMPRLSPRFALGDTVVTRNVHPAGHTRLPRYARGKQGVINLVHGPEIFPDTNAHGLGEHPQIVYNVRFDGHELWGDSAEPGTTVSIDLWESYLEPAPR